MAGKEVVRKVVLAYSGGLDTSVILPWLKETYGCEVIAYIADVGQGEELDSAKRRAEACGAAKVCAEDLREEFVQGYLFKALKAGAAYEGSYLLGTSLARYIIAGKQVEVAQREGADAVAHGCTGKGNDQVRFELTYMALDPSLVVIAPWKDERWPITSREDALAYAKTHNIPLDVSPKDIYSRDRNIWHLSHEGADLESPANEPQPSLFKISKPIEDAPDEPAYVQIEFGKGIPVALDGQPLSGAELVAKLNAAAGEHGIGQVDLVENRVVGMKSRGVYETPGGTVLRVAHRRLETLTLDRETAHYKDLVSQKYAELVYSGLWFTPLRRALDAFVDVTQEFVTGSVKMKLYKGNATPASVDSPYSLYSEDLASFAMGEYEPRNAAGFISLFGLPVKILGQIQKRAPK